MVKRSSRMMALLEYLQKHGSGTTPELAAKFGIRNIPMAILHLRELGFIIDVDYVINYRHGSNTYPRVGRYRYMGESMRVENG